MCFLSIHQSHAVVGAGASQDGAGGPREGCRDSIAYLPEDGVKAVPERLDAAADLVHGILGDWRTPIDNSHPTAVFFPAEAQVATMSTEDLKRSLTRGSFSNTPLHVLQYYFDEAVARYLSSIKNFTLQDLQKFVEKIDDRLLSSIPFTDEQDRNATELLDYMERVLLRLATR